MLETRRLNKIYGRGRRALHVLKDIELKVQNGEFVAIVGPSGAGKSTLLHLLGGIDSPSSGEVLLRNTNLYSLSEEEMARTLNKSVGFVFQFYHLLPDFIAVENVMLPAMVSGSRSKTRAEQLISRFGLSDRIRSFPSQLSGGEQQRLAVIRALINQPELLLCDEPTGNLDSKNGEDVLSMIKELNSSDGTTVVMVTHDEKVADIADRVVHLRDGIILN